MATVQIRIQSTEVIETPAPEENGDPSFITTPVTLAESFGARLNTEDEESHPVVTELDWEEIARDDGNGFVDVEATLPEDVEAEGAVVDWGPFTSIQAATEIPEEDEE